MVDQIKSLSGAGWHMGKAIIKRRQVLRGALAAGAMVALPMVSGRPARAQGAPLLHTTIANASGNLNLAMGELLRQLGYLEQFGVTAKVMNVSDGSKVLGGIIGGDIDSTMMSGFGQVFPAIAKGAGMKVIGGGGCCRRWRSIRAGRISSR
jgi:ABC-type nitrate/sulfonate/bicarbonate transport system substrate-binding protein